MNDRIKMIRKDNGLSQQKFADKLGISRGNIAAYEVGKNLPSDAVISLICTKFDINEDWLRTGNGEMKKDVDINWGKICADIGINDSKAREAIEKYYKLSDESKKIWWSFVDEFLK